MKKKYITMKIIHVITSLSSGGRERRMVQLVRGLSVEKKIEQFIVTLHAGGDYAGDIPDTVKIHSLGNGSKVDLLRKYYGLLNQINPDIVHLWTEVPLFLLSTTAFRFRFGYKMIVGFLADGNEVKSLLPKISNWLSFKFASAIISNSMAGIIAKKAPKGKSHVLYNGFDFRRFKPFDQQELRIQLKIFDRPVVMMAARFSEAKNWDMFLAVAEKIGEISHDILFMAVGAGDRLDYFKKLAEKKKITNIMFLGRRNDVENLLRISSLSLLFSNEKVHAEGVSNSIMESMAAGTPVVATMGGGTPEIITDGVDGFIVSPNDVEGAAERILNILKNSNLRSQLSKNAVFKVKSKFLLGNMTEQYKDIYKR